MFSEARLDTESEFALAFTEVAVPDTFSPPLAVMDAAPVKFKCTTSLKLFAWLSSAIESPLKVLAPATESTPLCPVDAALKVTLPCAAKPSTIKVLAFMVAVLTLPATRRLLVSAT